MVKLELELSDIDYDRILRDILPQVADRLRESGSSLAGLLNNPLASTLISGAPDSLKDKMAAELINMNAARLEQKLQEAAAQNGVPGTVRNLKATAVSES